MLEETSQTVAEEIIAETPALSDVSETVESNEEMQARIMRRKTINAEIIRSLKSNRKINKWMTGSRDFNEEDIVRDEDGNEVKSESHKEDNKWPQLEEVVNPVGTLEILLVVGCLEELTRVDPTWVYLKNEPSSIVKRVRKWLINNNQSIIGAFEHGSLTSAIEFCKIRDDKWGIWEYLSTPESTVEGYFPAENIVDKVQDPVQ